MVEKFWIGVALAYLTGSFVWCISVERRLTRIEQKISDLIYSLTKLVRLLKEGSGNGRNEKNLFI